MNPLNPERQGTLLQRKPLFYFCFHLHPPVTKREGNKKRSRQSFHRDIWFRQCSAFSGCFNFTSGSARVSFGKNIKYRREQRKITVYQHLRSGKSVPLMIKVKQYHRNKLLLTLLKYST